MITTRISFKCIMPGCNNKQYWYIMPLKEKTNSNDFVRSITKYELVCKKCKKTYILKFTIKAI